LALRSPVWALLGCLDDIVAWNSTVQTSLYMCKTTTDIAIHFPSLSCSYNTEPRETWPLNLASFGSWLEIYRCVLFTSPHNQSFLQTRARLPTSQRHRRASKELTDRMGARETAQHGTLDTVPSSHGLTRGAYRAVRHRCKWTFSPGQRAERRRSAKSTVRNCLWVRSCRRSTEQCYTYRANLSVLTA
jgi:hypothetical protein